MIHTKITIGHHAFDPNCQVCTLQAENKSLREWIRKHFIATCPDGECSHDCKKCPDADGWLKRILEGAKK